MGQEEQFRPSSLNVGCRFSTPTFDGTHWASSANSAEASDCVQADIERRALRWHMSVVRSVDGFEQWDQRRDIEKREIRPGYRRV